MGKLTVLALRAVLLVMLGGTVVVQAGMVWALVSESDPEDSSLPLTAFRVMTILGMASVQVAQAVARDVQATQLRAELDEVI